MKVVKTCEGNAVTFVGIKNGETFYYADDKERDMPMMKVVLSEEFPARNPVEEPNSVDLTDGYLYHTNLDEKVIPFRAKVVIE